MSVKLKYRVAPDHSMSICQCRRRGGSGASGARWFVIVQGEGTTQPNIPLLWSRECARIGQRRL
eukprot:14204349-Heterocapsa_arctica.AAC.1